MSQSVIELIKELTLALIETGHMPPEAMQETLEKTYATLTALKAHRRVRRLNPCPRFQDSASELAKEHHQTGGDLPGVRPSLQANNPAPSESARTGPPFVPDKIRYSADPTAFRSSDD